MDMLLYSRRVSFNNLYPTYIDPSNPAHIPPQFKDEQDQHNGKSRFFDLNFGFGGATINNIELHYTKQAPVNQFKRKIPKLPPPPSKSILKKNKYNGEINYTVTKSYGDHDNDDNDDQSGLLAGDDDDEEEDLPSTPPLPLAQVKPRRKSFADFTNEELIALEESYSTKSNLNIESFSFKNTPTAFVHPIESKSNKNLTVPASSTVATAAVDKVYPSRPVVEHGACCISSKHKNYDKIFKDDYNRVLLCCITGRRHTWNAIDYIINDIANDGDHVVITSHIPIRETEYLGHVNKYEEKADQEFEYSRNYNVSSALIYEKCQNILDYVIKLSTTKRLNMKISVEIINCASSKEVFNDSLKLYKPHLVFIGSKTGEDSLNRVMSISSSSSNDAETRPPFNRRDSSTVSAIGKGYNGYYRVGGSKCMKLTSYMIQHSNVPVVVVTSNYTTNKIKFRSPFGNDEDDDDVDDDIEEILSGDVNQFKKKLVMVSDTSRTKSINDITQFNNLKRFPSSGSSISSSDELPKRFTGGGALPSIKVTFGDDLGFGNGHSMYKVKSLLDPVENTLMAPTNTRSSYSSGSIGEKKKKERSKSEGNAPDNSSMTKFGLNLKKFGFGKKK